MEEEEVNEHIDICGEDLELDQQGGFFNEGGEIPSLLLENVDLGKDISSEYLGSSEIQGEDEHFEQMSLRDQDKIDGEHRDRENPKVLFSSENVTGPSNSPEVTSDLSSGSLVDKLDSSRGAELRVVRVDSGVGDKRNPSSSMSMDVYPKSGWSPIDSPQKYKPKPTMPSVSPELLHLIDSAIMGKPESLDKLKNIVNGVETFGGELDSDRMAFLVVDSLLATMGGVECFEEDDDENPPSVMFNARAAIVAGELIPWLPCAGDRMGSMSPRTRMMRGLLAILRACTRNRAMCSIAGLLGALLGSAERIFTQKAGSMEQMEWDGTPLCSCIQYLAGHSLSVIDLRRWFEVISKTLNTKWAPLLMLSLEKAVSGKETIGPASTFEFDGESSGLLGPGDTRWPFSNGYAVVTWIYMEAFEDPLNAATTAAAIAATAAAATAWKASPMSAAAAASALAGEGTAHMPRLFSFLAADNQGLEAYFHGQFLVVDCCAGKGKKVSLHFTHPFKSQCWYFIGIEHTCKQGLLGKAERELRLYIDGSLYETRPFEFPRISKPLQYCCIGTNPPPAMAGLQRRHRQCPLFAEMGPVYIFKDPIGPEKMSRLASRGGDVLPSFGTGVGLPWLATSAYVQNLVEESLLLDAELAVSIYLLYHPRLLSGRYCPDASPSGLAGPLRRPAEVLGQVHVASRQRPVEALWALAYGGPLSLLPLTVTSLKKDSLDPEPGNPALCLAATALAAPIFRIIAMAMQHPGNNEEIRRVRGPELLSKILTYLLQSLCSLDAKNHDGVGDEELVASVVSLCLAQKHNHALKVQLFSKLLLDLKLWSLCNYGLQKKLLSSLADMVFTESSVLRDASAIQMLLDGCRRCYWTIHEKDSVNTFSLKGKTRPIGEVNALIDELLVIIELLMVAAPPSLAADDMRCLLSFMLDCLQPNQVSRVLHLIYRLVVQPKASRAQTFAEAFMSCGGIETLLVLLQREAMSGDQDFLSPSIANDEKGVPIDSSAVARDNGVSESSDVDNFESLEEKKTPSQGEGLVVEPLSNQNRMDPDLMNVNSDLGNFTTDIPVERTTSVSESLFVKNVGGINLSISAHNARNNVYNFDQSDGTVVGIIKLLGTLVTSGYLKFNLNNHPSLDATASSGLPDSGGSMFDDKVSLLLFSLQKAFQGAPQRLMTSNVYTALLTASINATSTDDDLNLYDFGHRFEHLQLLLVLLRSLPYASALLQNQVLQDLLFLACSHPENRSCLTRMEEWPEWILEVLISNYEKGALDSLNSSSFVDVEDIIHSFLIIVLEHSMRQKEGWKHIEATIHCAEWLCMVGGSSTGEQRVRREESLPIFKRRLLGSLLDFSARELQVQTEVIAAAAAGVAVEFSSATNAKAEAENATQLSVTLVENSIVLLLLVEDHLRLQSKLYGTRCSADGTFSNLASANHPKSTMAAGRLKFDLGYQKSYTEGLPLDVLASLTDENGQLSAAVMERLTAAAAAEPYESVTYAFVSYGSCVRDLQEGWTYRSRLWYGVGAPSKHDMFGGGGSGWESWNSVLEKDANGCWIELPLIKKSVNMLQALLLDESGLGGGLGTGSGSSTGLGGMAALYQLLDSDQPFLCMLRMVLASMREDDTGDEGVLMRKMSFDDALFDGSDQQSGNIPVLDNIARVSARKPRSALLWSVLSPVLNMPISESKRQRVLVASCVLYSEVWHAIGKDRKILRKQYLETILPPFVAILRRWRPLLAGIHELATADGLNPLVDDRVLAADALPVEGALAMIFPGWAAAFASPPAAMALAMIAAGASGGDGPARASSTQIKQAMSTLEHKTAKLQTFSSFQIPNKPPGALKDKAAAKAAALAAARDLECSAKIGLGRGLGAVAMATSAQRRNASDMERARRWSLSEAMGTAWMDCLQPVGSKSVYGKDFSALSYKFIAVLVASFALARNIQRSEIDRRTHVDMLAQHHVVTGNHAWRKLVHYLIEMKCLFGSVGDHLFYSERVFWKLHPIESSSRMRRCLKGNYQASPCMFAPASYDSVFLKHDEQKVTSASHAPVPGAAVLCVEALIDDDEHAAISNTFSDFNEEEYVENQLRLSSGEELSIQVSSESNKVPAANSLDIIEDPSAVAPGYVPSESDERIIIELPCSMVKPLRVARGTFQITTRKINFIAENMEDASSSNELVLSSETRDHVKNRSWSISSLNQIYNRRYLLRRSALELFLLDHRTYFFDFGTTEGRRNAFRAIDHACPPHMSNMCLTTQRPDQLLKRTQLTERWARWEISNFEYLMHLNTLAGRSYNDISQYPIFPWVLADYASQILDLSNPSSYRDLSKPVGALNPERLKKFQERYSSFDDPVIPKFHYDSHYSSAKTVLYYLVRVEPFTSLFIQMQDRNVDHADPMFSDVAATWIGILEDMNDVKELVPEMFCLPEMLTNENSIDFGASHLGQKFDSVKIPPWAENPVDFIHKHRMALESEHVSSHLHEWIDLIFGYKQQGKDAISANNVFSYITYEGMIDIDRISDPVQQHVIQDQIAYFGQTPSQLLTVPHKKRMPLAKVLQMQTIFKNPKALKPYVVPMPDRCNLPASAMHASSDSVVIVDIHAPAAYVAEHKWQAHTPENQGSPFVFDHKKAPASSSGGALMRMFKGPSGNVSNNSNFPQALAFPTSGIRRSAVVAITSDREIITGGHADNSIRIISAEGAKPLETAIGHCAPVTCLALSSDSTYLVTGSRDTTVLLWRIHCIASNAHTSDVSEPPRGSDSSTSTSSNALASILADKSRRRRIEGPIHVLRGHLKEVLCCCVSSDLGVIVSCSQSADVLLHTVRRGRLIRRLAGVDADAVCLSSEGIIMAWDQSQHIFSTYTLNGILIARVELPFYGSISCMEVSYDGQTALVGVNLCSGKEGSTGEHENCRLDIPSPSICFLDLYTLKVLHTLKLQDGQDISAMTLDKDKKRLLVSTMDRQLIVFTDPALSSKAG